MGGPGPAPRRAGDDGASDPARVDEATAASRDDHALLASIVRSSRDAIFTADVSGTITSWNAGAERLFGYAASEIVGRPVDLLVPEERADEPHWLIPRVLAGEPVDGFETQRCRKDGTIFDVSLTISPVLDASGAAIGLSVIGHDITERKRAEAEDARHLRFVEGMDRVNQAIQSGADLDQVMTDVMDVTVDLLGCDRALLLFPCDPDASEYVALLERRRSPDVRHVAARLPIPRSESTAELFRLALTGDGPFAHGTGNERELPQDVAERLGIHSLIAMALRPRHGPPWLLVLHQCDRPRTWTGEERELLREIGRRLTDSLSTLLAARELAHSEAMYRRLVDTAGEGVWAIDVDGITTFVNDRMAQMLGRPIDEIVGRPAASLMFDEDIADHARQLVSRRDDGPNDFDRRFRRADGTELWTHVSVSSVTDDDGRTTGVFAMLSDIGDRRRAEEELRQSEDKFATTFRMSPDLIILTRTTDGVILDVNESFERLLGYSCAAAVGRTTSELGAWMEDTDRTTFLALLAELGEVRDLETLLRHRDGHLVIGSTSARRLVVNGEPCLLSVVRDVTDRRVAERRLRDSEAQYRSLIENLPDPIVRIDRDLRRTYVNHAWSVFNEAATTDAIGTFLHDRTPPWLITHVERAIATGRSDEIEFDWTAPGGSTYTLQYKLVPEFDSDGNVTSVLAVGRDLTERRQAEELRIAKLTAEQASRAKSAFIASMSHEIRTPMNAILGFAQLLRNDPSLDPRQRAQVEVINTSGEHLVDIVNDVLELSKIEAGRAVVSLAPFDLHALVVEVETLFAPRALAKGLALHVHRRPHLPQHVVTDGGKLRQILINLLGNAVKFTAAGHISVHLAHRATEEGGRLVVEVEDTGRGISPEDQPRLFGYFEQAAVADDQETGTGLGLAISRGFARLLDGDLTVRSTLGVGSTFRLEIDAPLATWSRDRTEARERHVTGLAAGQPAHRVLVADDSAANRELLCEILEQVGFVARSAVDGAEAVEVFTAWRPDVVLMDMRMPVVNGREATRRIRDIDPAAKVIAVTADVFIADAGSARAAGIDAVLTKPFRTSTLFDVIGGVLDVEYTFSADE